jgi:hypothetical protein
MPRNGSGEFLPNNSSWRPGINGVLATAGDWNALLNDISSALTQSVSRDGQSPMQGNLNLANNKITNLAPGTATTDAATWAQLFGAGVQADIASAATTDIGQQNTSFLRVTGTTTITSFGTSYRGPRFLTFADAVTLTNSSTLALPGGANITTAAGDSLIVIPGATSGTADKWIVVGYQKSQVPGTIDQTKLTSKIEPVTASVASNALTVTLNPTVLDFRSATLGSGTVNTRSVSTAISAVVPSGATLGTTNATLSQIILIALDNAGTVELAVCNSSATLDESALISTTALSADSDSATVVYSTTARTNVPFRVVGFVESTQSTAGTWASAPSKIQGYGGLALQPTPRSITSATAVTASGTSVDFTNIPPNVKRITVMFSGISTNGSADVQVLLGTSAGFEANGYLGIVTNQGASSATYANLSTGFDVTETNAASVVLYGQMVINNLTGNTWTAAGQVGRTDATFLSSTQGGKSLLGTLNRIRITTANGTDVFDAGTINILMEG